MANAGLFKEVALFTAAILAAAVAVADEAFGDGTGAGGLTEGIANEGGFEVAGEGPADDVPGAKINHHGQIEPAFAGGNIRADRRETASRQAAPQGEAKLKQMSPARTALGGSGSG